MQSSELIFYIGIGLVIFFLFMLKKDKPKLPTPLKMQDFTPKKEYLRKQLTGSKPVSAEVIEDEVEVEVSADWASPVIIADGKVKDAYAVLGLDAGVPMAQVRAQVSSLLEQKNTPAKIDLIKRAYRAIIDANNS